MRRDYGRASERSNRVLRQRFEQSIHEDRLDPIYLPQDRSSQVLRAGSMLVLHLVPTDTSETRQGRSDSCPRSMVDIFQTTAESFLCIHGARLPLLLLSLYDSPKA